MLRAVNSLGEDFHLVGEDVPLLEWHCPGGSGFHAYWTTRIGGVSSGLYSSLNLGGRDDETAVAENRRTLAARLGLKDLSSVRTVHQVHGGLVADGTAASSCVAWDSEDLIEADAIAIDGSYGGAVFTADCMAIVIVSTASAPDDTHHSLAGRAVVIHAGWKGIAAGVIESAVDSMRVAGFDPQTLRAAIGPSLGPCCFDAGEEVATAIGADAEHGEWMWREALPAWRSVPPRKGTRSTNDPQPALRRIFVDAPKVARRRLTSAGITRVAVAPMCTACDDRWFSYRADGPQTGRQALVVLPSLAGQ